ncbi:MAG: YceI family protein [Alphaproteobacteria bacterium]
MGSRIRVSWRRACAPIFVAMVLGAAPAAAKPEAYELDPAHTQVLFSVERFGFTRILGFFEETEGTVRIDEEDPGRSSVNTVIRTASLDSGDEKRDEALRGKFWFDTAAHSEIRFRSTSVEPTGPGSAKVTGKLTVKGVTRSVTLDVKLLKTGQDPATQRQAAGFSASTQISRADFGMTTAANLIGDRVDIRIYALAHRAEE